MEIRQSSEDYLEAILMLQNRKGIVRSIDIAEELSVTKPSVSVAMKKLRTNGYIEMDEYGFISLKETGREIAERMYERHTYLTKWLTTMGVDPDIAATAVKPINKMLEISKHLK